MKPIQLVSCLFVLVCMNYATAQVTIEVDFLDDTPFQGLDYLEADETYVFKVINVNRTLYKIDGKTEQTEFNVDVPSIFKDIKLPGFINLSVPDTEAFNIEKIMIMNDPVDSIEAIFNEVEGYNEQFTDIGYFDNYLTNAIKTCGKSYNDIEKELIKETANYIPTATVSQSRTDQATEISAFLNDLVDNAKSAEDDLESLFLLKKIEIDSVINENKDRLLRLEITQPDANRNLDSEYAKNKMESDSLTRDNTNQQNYLTQLRSRVDEAIEVIKVIKTFKTENNIEQLVNKYKVINKANFTYISEPVKVTKDELTFTFEASSEALLFCDQQNKKIIKKTFQTKGGWKVDFSTGVFFNGGNDDFFGRELYYSTVSETTSVIKEKDGGTRALLGIGGLMHIYKRSDKNVNWAISPGLSSSTDFDQLNFHLGGSALFGKKNRIVITAGITLRESNILDKTFKLNTEYETSALPESPLIKVFPRFGYFISLTYNFSKFKSE